MQEIENKVSKNLGSSYKIIFFFTSDVPKLIESYSANIFGYVVNKKDHSADLNLHATFTMVLTYHGHEILSQRRLKLEKLYGQFFCEKVMCDEMSIP